MTQRSQRRKEHEEMPYEDEIPPYAALAEPSEEINQLAHRVLGICIEIHRELGPGLPEEAYEEALAIEFEARGIRFERQLRIPIYYKGRCVARVRLDFLIESMLVLEAKSVDALTPIDRKQVIRYLEVTKLPLGLLVNFNVSVLKDGIRRVVRSEPTT
jgi:GxxExxY protein